MIVADSDYLKQLDIIRKIRDTIKATDEVSLPQICVIGDQSSGKSSFLSRLTGVTFPTAAKMCTKAAVVVTCNRDESLTKPRYEIEDWKHPGMYSEIESTGDAIQMTQDALLQKMASNKGTKWNADENSIVSDQSIKLRLTSPEVIDIIVVDLPGIQHAGNTKDAILALIEQNIKKPETLNLLVSEAKQDAELTEAIEIAKKYDPDRSRTIRVLSKFDNFDTLATQDRAVKLVQDGLVSATGSQVAGARNLGPHAIISIDKNGKLRTDKHGDARECKQLTEEYKVPRDRAGIITLKNRLQPLFAKLIKEHLPTLKQRVSDGFNKTQADLERVGRKSKSSTEIVNCCHHVLKENVELLEEDLTNKCLLLLKKSINAMKDQITFEFATDGFEMNAFHCPVFQGQKTFDAALKKIQQLWEPFVDEFIKVASELTFEATQCLGRTKSTKIYGRVTSIIQGEHHEFVQSKVIPVFKNACYEALRDEATFGTTNHYFDSKFREDEICPPELISLFSKKAKALLKDDTKSPMDPSRAHGSYRHVSSEYLKQCLLEAKAEVAHNQVHSNLMETQKKRVYSAVIANFDVEKKTFVDVLLKKLKK